MPPLVVKPVQMPDKLFPPAPQLVRCCGCDWLLPEFNYILPALCLDQPAI